VGLVIATTFGQIQKIIGYDNNPSRINELKNAYDRNQEVSTEYLNSANIEYTTNPDDLKKANFHIVTVLTPIDFTNRPDISILLNVTEIIGRQLKKGDIVVFESTVYPGATEEKCIPILERASKLICGKDFSVGYSPERINPSDKEHVFTNIIKIIAATDIKTLDIIESVYTQVIHAGVYRVSSIRVAEAAKVIENTQRDVNISLINEIALILQVLGMDSTEVITATQTKWNALPFRPGLVGGHCIGVNSIYLTYKAEEAGYYPALIQAGRRVNDHMAKFIVEKTIKNLIALNVPINKARVAILGFTYKENCPDVHNTRVFDVVNELLSYGTQVFVNDPIANKDTVKDLYDIDLTAWEELTSIDAILIVVAHNYYMEVDKQQLKGMIRKPGLILDIKNVLSPNEFKNTGITIWRL
jgi:UDP-N-acetyl-D-galactosamine dehydrogenase